MSDPTDLKELKSMDSFALPASNPTSGSMPQNMGLADLARGLQYVVNEAAMAAHLHMQKTLDLYFDAEGNPRCRRVHLPGGGGSVDVPVIALTPPANLMLEQMEVALAVRVTNLRPVTDAARPAPKAEQSAESAESAESTEEEGPSPHVFVTPAPESGAPVPPPPSAPAHAKPKASSFAVETPDEEPSRRRSDRRVLERLSFEIQPAPVSPDSAARRDANVMDIKMIFRRNESPEGVARLVALYTDAMFRIAPPEQK